MFSTRFKSQVFSILLLQCSFSLFSTAGFASLLPFKVVIDPGHGGNDEGTVYKQGSLRVTEKELTLRISKQVAKILRIMGHQVTLTRYTDREVPLPQRTALANRLGADVFLSIHMNSTRGLNTTDAEGIETYILNNATDASSKRLAKIENSVLSSYSIERAPPKKDVALILKDLRLDSNLIESKGLACEIQKNLVSATSKVQNFQKRNRGVKQALFHVLLGADMPSILIETGFLNSAYDRSLMLSQSGLLKSSYAIASAIDKFRSVKNHSRKHWLELAKCKIH